MGLLQYYLFIFRKCSSAFKSQKLGQTRHGSPPELIWVSPACFSFLSISHQLLGTNFSTNAVGTNLDWDHVIGEGKHPLWCFPDLELEWLDLCLAIPGAHGAGHEEGDHQRYTGTGEIPTVPWWTQQPLWVKSEWGEDVRTIQFVSLPEMAAGSIICSIGETTHAAP